MPAIACLVKPRPTPELFSGDPPNSFGEALLLWLHHHQLLQHWRVQRKVFDRHGTGMFLSQEGNTTKRPVRHCAISVFDHSLSIVHTLHA